MNRVLMIGCAVWALAAPLAVHGAYGVFTHGQGIESQGMGGIAFTSISETYVAFTNPALLQRSGDRLDVGLDYIWVSATAGIDNSPTGPDATFKADRTRHFPIPQVGYARRLSPRVTLGLSAFSAGLGADYSNGPYARFGADAGNSLSLTQSGVALAGAYAPVPGQLIGFSINPGYQVIEIEGLGAFSGASATPDRFSDTGSGGAFGVSFTWGWHGEIAPWLDAALSYRSRTFSQRIRRYSGLLPEQGRFQIPAVWGGGLSLTPHRNWVIAVEAQRVEYASEVAFANGIDRFEAGALFGADDGPGFGWRDQNVYKLGVSWQVTPALRLMAGGSHATQLIPLGEMFLNMLAPAILRQHYTLGLRYAFARWTVTGYSAYTPTRFQRGTDAIPAAFGGGDATARGKMHMFGISFSRSLGTSAAHP